MKNLKDIKVAIVCDSLDQYGGAEKIVEAMHEIFPDAPIYTSFYDKEKMQKHGFIDEDKKIITPKWGESKLLLRLAKAIFPIYPLIFESFDFTGYDLVLSSSSRFAHGIITNSDTIHISYLHSPARYAWDYFQYKQGLALNPFLKIFYQTLVSYLRIWDRAAADRVDYFIANSRYTNLRIKKFYKKDSTVINPFIDIKRFKGVDFKENGTYFLYLGRFIKWRRLDIIIDYFNKSGQSLRLVGNGDPGYVERLKKRAKANIEFFEKQTNDQVVGHLNGAKALIWPSIEDFGIAPLEAQAAGKPVIAFKKGGSIDVIEEGVTGIFFDEQTSESLGDAIEKFNSMKFSSEDCIKNSHKFKKEKFIRDLSNYILSVLNESRFDS